VTGPARPAPGIVVVRLSGHPGDAGALAAILASIPAVQILTGPDGPYPNRRQPGHRLYLTLRLTQPPPPSPEHAGNPGTAPAPARPGRTPETPPAPAGEHTPSTMTSPDQEQPR
jgi:hypothetical protein